MAQETRLYGLFEIEVLPGGRKKYHRLMPGASFKKSTAVRVFQSALLAPVMAAVPNKLRSRCLRPVKPAVAAHTIHEGDQA